MQPDFQIVDRVECPSCHQRTFVELDCVCCGGIGFVDTDIIQPIIEATLADLESGKARSSKNSWLPIGIYPFRDGTWFIVDQLRNTRKITEQEVNAILFVDEPFLVDLLMMRAETLVSKLFRRIYSLIRKPGPPSRLLREESISRDQMAKSQQTQPRVDATLCRRHKLLK